MPRLTTIPEEGRRYQDSAEIGKWLRIATQGNNMLHVTHTLPIVFWVTDKFSLNHWKTGAGEEIRTLDPNLGKVVLYP